MVEQYVADCMLVLCGLFVCRQQRTSACEVEFTKEMCESVLKTLQSTWDLTPSDLKRVANVIKVEEEVINVCHVYHDCCWSSSVIVLLYCFVIK